MPALRRGDHNGPRLLDAERRHGLGFRLRQRIHFDGLTFTIEPIELGGDLCGFVRIVFHQQPDPEIGPADTSAGVDARAKQKSEMPGFRRT